MSIEEARNAVHWRCDIAFEDTAYVRDALDRLILEVRAEIDCEWAGGDQIFDCTGALGETMYPQFARGELCRTCEARAQLQVQAICPEADIDGNQLSLTPEEARLLTLKVAK